MGNSATNPNSAINLNQPLDPNSIDLATFKPESLQTIQKNNNLKAYVESKFKRKPQNQIIIQEGSRQYTFWQVFPQDLSLNDLETLFKSLSYVRITNIFFNQLQQYHYAVFYHKQFNLLKSLCYPYFTNLLRLSVNHCGIKSLQSIQFLYAPQLKTLYLKYNPFINFKPFNKCRFKNLKYLQVQNNSTREVFYLSDFTRCDLNDQIKQISFDDNYKLTKSYIYNHLLKPKQSMDLSAVLKWNSKVIHNMAIRQPPTHIGGSMLIRSTPIISNEYKIRYTIKQKYQKIYFEIVTEQKMNSLRIDYLRQLKVRLRTSTSQYNQCIKQYKKTYFQ